MKRVVLLAMGGTISSTGSFGDVHSDLSGESILESSGEQSDTQVEVEVINVSRESSPNTTPQQMVDLADRINHELEKTEVAAAVVTHGTSTMEETAFILDLLVTGEKPVVVTGAMRSADSAWPDGPSNLRDAMTVAVSPETPAGTVVVFNGKIHAGRYAHKSNSIDLEAFSSGDKGLIGRVYYGKAEYFWKRERKTLAYRGKLEKSAAILPFYSGADDRYIRAAVELGEKGIVIDGVGLGNVNGAYEEGIRSAIQNGVSVVVTSRCDCGPVVPMYGDQGGAGQLKKLGVHFSDLSSYKARLVLLLGLNGAFPMNELDDWLRA